MKTILAMRVIFRKPEKSLLRIVALILPLLVMTGCLGIFYTKAYPNVKFKVVDAETGQPIEGAVLLVSWSKLNPIYSVSTFYREDEMLSDQNGIFVVPGIFKTGLDLPTVSAYKRGYVGWRHDWIFPAYEKRIDFKWHNGYTIRLEKYKPEYSRGKHVSFLRAGGSGAGGIWIL